MNRTQYERGALLVVPNAHRETVLDVEADLLGSIYSEAKALAAAMVHAFGAVGVNVFSNNGVPAGQSIAHFHVHVVPRYAASEPFRSFRAEEFEHMPIGELEELARELREALPMVGPE
jgi:histidine triad (HIT) family protein